MATKYFELNQPDYPGGYRKITVERHGDRVVVRIGRSNDLSRSYELGYGFEGEALDHLIDALTNARDDVERVEQEGREVASRYAEGKATKEELMAALRPARRSV